MSLFFIYDGTDFGNQRIRLGSGFSFTEAAESGVLAMSQIRIDDTAGSLNIVGHRPFRAIETACSFESLFRGYFADRTYSREASLRLGAARVIDSTVYDLNGALQFEVIRGATGKRPAETDTERIEWLLGSAFKGPLSSDDSNVFGDDVDMDKTDYRGQTAADVLQDCATMSGFNFFVAWDQTLNAPVLHYYAPTRAHFTSSLSISNDLSDVNMTTVYAPDHDMKLNRDPSRVFSGVYYQYGDRTSAAVFEESAGVLADIGHKRETSVTDSAANSENRATAKANKYLAEADTELDLITVTLYKVRPQDVNEIRAGHRIQIKATHLPGYSTYQWMRVQRRTVTQDGETQLFYKVTLQLSDPQQAGPGNRHRPQRHPDADPPVGDNTSITLTARECRNRFDGFDGDPIAEIAYDNPLLKSIGSLVFHNIPYTTCGCPLGPGGWSGVATYEGWWEFTTGTLADNVVGVRFTVGAVNTSFAYGLYDQPYLYGWRNSAPTDVDQYNPVGYIDWTANGAVVDLPRAAINEGGTTYFCIAPGWRAGTNWFFCAQDLVNGTNGPAGAVTSGGEGNSGRVRTPSVTAEYLIADGTSGLAPWIAADGAINGNNKTFTLYGWDGTDRPGVQVNGLIIGAADFEIDDSAGTVTLNVAPQTGDVVLFRYQMGV